jgi:hypothetical protein
MRHTSKRRSFVAMIVLALLMGVTMPATSLAQDRRNNQGWNINNRKCGKFVNCHDASEGRRDGRGRRSASGWNQRRWRENRWSNNNDQRRSVRSWYGRQDYTRSIRLRDNRWRRN